MRNNRVYSGGFIIELCDQMERSSSYLLNELIEDGYDNDKYIFQVTTQGNHVYVEFELAENYIPNTNKIDVKRLSEITAEEVKNKLYFDGYGECKIIDID